MADKMSCCAVLMAVAALWTFALPVGADVIVTGSTSTTFVGDTTFYVGYSGEGTLRVEEEGQVFNANGYIGYSVGSTGTARVTGGRSAWYNRQSLTHLLQCDFIRFASYDSYKIGGAPWHYTLPSGAEGPGS